RRGFGWAGERTQSAAPTRFLRLRLPLARALLRLGELVGRHLARDRVAVLDRGGAVARVVGGKARGGEIEPHVRVDGVLRHALAAGVGEAEIVLRLGVALLGGAAIPARRLGVVLRHAAAFADPPPEREARGGFPLVGGEANPLRRLVVVLRHAAAAVIGRAEDCLGAGIAGLGERAREPQRLGVVGLLERG